MNAMHTVSHVTKFPSPVYSQTQYIMHTAWLAVCSHVYSHYQSC